MCKRNLNRYADTKKALIVGSFIRFFIFKGQVFLFKRIYAAGKCFRKLFGISVKRLKVYLG